jgi:hypothetical protein
MLKITIKQPLSFIQKEGLTEFYIEPRSGMYRLTSGQFVQVITSKQYAEIVENAVAKSDEKIKAPVVAETVKTEEPKAEEKSGRGTLRK